jgi:hypothetical protein
VNDILMRVEAVVLSRRMVLRSLAALAAGTACNDVLGQEAIPLGAFASISAGGAPLMVNRQPAAQLPENTWFEIARSSGSWTAGYAYLDGDRKSGWVQTARLLPESIERQAQVAAAWKERGAKVETDAHGAVLSIDAADTEAGDAELVHAIAFPRLEELSLAGTKTTAAGLAKLAGLPRLKRLFLDGLPLADAGLKPLAKLAGLESLSLADLPITDAGLEHVSGLTNLQVLNLSNCAITDDGLLFLAPLVNVETLALKNAQVRGQGFHHLQGMERLNVLNVNHCPIEGEQLQLLNGMQHLRILHVAGCNIEPKYIEALENNTVSLAVFD